MCYRKRLTKVIIGLIGSLATVSAFANPCLEAKASCQDKNQHWISQCLSHVKELREPMKNLHRTLKLDDVCNTGQRVFQQACEQHEVACTEQRIEKLKRLSGSNTGSLS